MSETIQLIYQARVKDALKKNDKIVGIIGRSVLIDIKITIKNFEYADELLDFLKYHSLDGTSENLGVLSKKTFYSKYLKKGEHIGKFLATMHSDGQKLKISEDELIEYLFSKGTLPETWKSFIDGIKLNDKYRKNWFNLREVLIDYGTELGYNGELNLRQAKDQIPKEEKAAMNAEKKSIKCFFCSKEGHIKAYCRKYENWKANKKNEETKREDKKFSWDNTKKKAINSINKHLFQVHRSNVKEKEQKQKVKDDQYV